MKLKKVLALTLAACMVCTSMVACSKNDNKTQGNDTNTSQEGNKEEKPGATTGGKKVLSVTTWDNDT